MINNGNSIGMDTPTVIVIGGKCLPFCVHVFKTSLSDSSVSSIHDVTPKLKFVKLLSWILELEVKYGG